MTEGFGTAELIETDVLVDAKKLSQVLGSIGLVGSIVGAGLALWMFAHRIRLGEITGMLGYLEVRPETAAAAVGSAVFVSLASALGPVIRAMRVVPAVAFREVVRGGWRRLVALYPPILHQG